MRSRNAMRCPRNPAGTCGVSSAPAARGNHSRAVGRSQFSAFHAWTGENSLVGTRVLPGERGQTPFVRSTRRAAPAKGASPPFHPWVIFCNQSFCPSKETTDEFVREFPRMAGALR